LFGEDSAACKDDLHVDAADTFEEFWKQYPRKVGKVAAAKLYRRIVNNGDATPADLMIGIARYGLEVAGREPRYIAHPTTWLSQGRWADEVSPSIAPGTTTLDAAGNPIAAPPPNRRPANEHAARFQERLDRLKAQAGGAK
jgi:hypothetical protein